MDDGKDREVGILSVGLVHESAVLQVEVEGSGKGRLLIRAMRLVRREDAAGVVGEECSAEGEVGEVVVYPASHHTADAAAVKRLITSIREELAERVHELRMAGSHLEADRLSSRVKYDLACLEESGSCPGMENYAGLLSGRAEGEPPPTLLDYMPRDWLLLVDECHVTLPQLRSMGAADGSRKAALVANGFRLPSARRNRPLDEGEFWERVERALLVSATPGEEASALCGGSVSELLVRPTGIVDPRVEVVSCEKEGGYEDYLLAQIAARGERGERCLVTCLTKHSAEGEEGSGSGRGGGVEVEGRRGGGRGDASQLGGERVGPHSTWDGEDWGRMRGSGRGGGECLGAG